MQDLYPIQVVCHSGYKADEYPVSFIWESNRFKILQILDRWYQCDRNPPFPKANYFKVSTAGNKIWILKHDMDKGLWYLWVKGERLDHF